MKIGLKLSLGFLAVVVPLTLLFYAEGLYSQKTSLDNWVVERINYVKNTFRHLEERDTNMLSSALEVVIRDPAFKEAYLKKDREKLYDFGQPLFQDLKNKYGITHFYFILPDGHCFVRLHNKEIYGDLITRFTFWKARDTKALGSGIELGKTAFALRTVMPYYDNGQLIGYVELGEEIDHFLEILKSETGDEFAIIGEKEHLDREKWRSVKQAAGLRDNWDDLEEHVVISTTVNSTGIINTGMEEPVAAECFSEANLEKAEKGEMLPQRIRSNDRNFACGGFLITDAGGRHAGAVLSLIDITEQVAVARKANRITLGIAIILFITASGISILISHSISNPVTSLRDAAAEITKGNLDKKVEITSRDEIGQLGNAFNEMTSKLKESYAGLEEKVDERTKQLEETQEQLVRKEKLAAVGQLASSIGHELRNPLGVIGNAAYYLNMKLPDADEKVKKHLDILQREVQRSNAIIRDLLDFSRISPPSLEEVDVNNIVKDALADIKLPENVALETGLDKDLPVISADPRQIQQMFQNFISNAIEAMPEGGRLVINTGTKDDFVEIILKDTGVGIPEENLQKIFDPLFTTKAVGIGLGMAIAKGIIDRHGGRIEAESEAGAGTTFTVKLPFMAREGK